MIKICTIFNNFNNVVSALKIANYCNYFLQKKHTHSFSTITETFEKHPSILNIIKKKLNSVFSFRKTTGKEVSKDIRDLNTKNVVRGVPLSLKLLS